MTVVLYLCLYYWHHWQNLQNSQEQIFKYTDLCANYVLRNWNFAFHINRLKNARLDTTFLVIYKTLSRRLTFMGFT